MQARLLVTLKIVRSSFFASNVPADNSLIASTRKKKLGGAVPLKTAHH